MKIIYENENTYLKEVKNLDIALTLDCGQAFRWEQRDNIWRGMAKGVYLELEQTGDTVVFYNTDERVFREIWWDYFDLERDYGAIINTLCTDERFKIPCREGEGIRLLNQEPWEALCSFIISQNNNIPRIKGIIDRLCLNFGEKCGNTYSFPSAEILANKIPEDLSCLRAGFRAKYIIDAAKKVHSGEVSLEKLPLLPLDDARNELMKIFGVGPKVADCALLFSLGFKNAFPKDVWIKRIMECRFNGILPECAAEFAGIAQQYLFNYARTHSEEFN